MRTKQDRARISTQEWEIDYCNKLAREIIDYPFAANNPSKVRRVAKALLRFTEKWKRQQRKKKQQ
jgi:hypothetical protein